jgi:hypothetical protein
LVFIPFGFWFFEAQQSRFLSAFSCSRLYLCSFLTKDIGLIRARIQLYYCYGDFIIFPAIIIALYALTTFPDLLSLLNFTFLSIYNQDVIVSYHPTKVSHNPIEVEHQPIKVSHQPIEVNHQPRLLHRRG